MGEINITYETLFDLLRRERNREDLQQLQENFTTDVRTYLLQKKVIMEQITSSDGFSISSEAEKARIQFHNIKKILKELHNRREKKIVLLALNAVRTGVGLVNQTNFLSHELLFFNDLMHLFSKQRTTSFETFFNVTSQVTTSKENISQSLPAEKEEDRKEKSSPAVPKEVSEEKTMRLKFLRAVPRFAGGEKEVFGPFALGDEADLPVKIAQVLIKKNRAQQA